MAVWVDEYHSVYPTMPASIEGLGLNGIVSEVGKKIIAAALLAYFFYFKQKVKLFEGF